MSLFILRTWFKQILAAAQKNKKEIKTMSAALDNLTAAVNAAVAQLGALSAEVASLKAEIAAGSDDAAKQALADQLNAAVAANPI